MPVSEEAVLLTGLETQWNLAVHLVVRGEKASQAEDEDLKIPVAVAPEDHREISEVMGGLAENRVADQAGMVPPILNSFSMTSMQTVTALSQNRSSSNSMRITGHLRDMTKDSPDSGSLQEVAAEYDPDILDNLHLVDLLQRKTQGTAPR